MTPKQVYARSWLGFRSNSRTYVQVEQMLRRIGIPRRIVCTHVRSVRRLPISLSIYTKYYIAKHRVAILSTSQYTQFNNSRMVLNACADCVFYKHYLNNSRSKLVNVHSYARTVSCLRPQVHTRTQTHVPFRISRSTGSFTWSSRHAKVKRTSNIHTAQQLRDTVANVLQETMVLKWTCMHCKLEKIKRHFNSEIFFTFFAAYNIKDQGRYICYATCHHHFDNNTA